MRNAGLEEAQAGIKIAGKNIYNLRYTDDTTFMAESKEELTSLLMKVKVESENAKSLQSCPTLCDPMDCSPLGSSVHGDSLGKNTSVGCHVLLQGIFPTQGLNPGILHCRWILYQLSH